MPGGTLGAAAGKADCAAAAEEDGEEEEGLIEVRRRFASSSLTLFWGLSAEHRL